MLFYRVCHRDRTSGPPGEEVYAGPYNGHGINSYRLRRMGWAHVDDGHPDVYEDVFARVLDHRPDIDPYDYVCGFAGPDDYRSWFYGYRSFLRHMGFVLRTYDVPSSAMFVGEKQAACHRGAIYKAELAGAYRTKVLR